MHMQQATSPRSTYSASPILNSPDLQKEMDLAKERLLRQQQTILASAPAPPAVVVSQSKAAPPMAVKETTVAHAATTEMNSEHTPVAKVCLFTLYVHVFFACLHVLIGVP